MQFRPIPVAEPLRPYIRNYWILTLRVLEPEGRVRIMTNGASCMMLLPGNRLVLHGPSMSNFSVGFTAGEHTILGLEFHPAGVHAFFEQPTSRFVDQHIPAEQLGQDFTELKQQLTQMQDVADYSDEMDDFFLRRLKQFGRGESINMRRMMKVFAYIESHHPVEMTIADLASEACLSPRQFNRIFTEFVGLTPKEYLRIYRFHAALLSLREHPEHTTLMQLAWDNGYYDIQHMNAEFKNICRHTPSSTMQLGERLTEVFAPEFSMLMKKKILQENIE